MGAGDTRCGSSQQGYRHVGLHERVPLDSRKAHRSIIQPQHPANLNAAAPSFQSKMLSGSARLWHSACNVMFAGTASNPIPQALTAAQGETVSEEHPRSTSRRDGINQATWDEHHNNKKLRSHENINESLASVRVGNSSTSTRIELAEQRRTQRARARYHPYHCQELTRARKAGEMATSDGKPRAQAIPRRCFSRARTRVQQACMQHPQCSARGWAGRDEIGWQLAARRSIYKYIVLTARVAVPCERALQSSCSVTELLKLLRIADDGKSAAWKEK